MRKKAVLFVLLAGILLGLPGCTNAQKNDTELETILLPSQVWTRAECSKEDVQAFADAFEASAFNVPSYGAHDEAHCYNVTPGAVSEQTAFRIFKFSEDCASYVWIDGEICDLCASFGGYGFLNAVPWDYDGDGTMDLLVASSWGSGLHRSEISVFDGRTKEPAVICTSLGWKDEQVDWFVSAAAPSTMAQTPGQTPVFYVYDADVRTAGHLAELSYIARSCVGWITAENGTPEFCPYTP